MNKKLRITLIFFSLIFSSVAAVAQNFSYGLEFNSFEVVQEKRTSLNLSPAKPFVFPEGFSLSFDLFFRSAPQYNFGYVFRIIGENSQHFDFLATPEKLTVVNSEDKVLAESLIAEAGNNFTSFFTFLIHIDIRNNTLKINIGEKEFSHQVNSLKDFKSARIIFGKCDYPLYQTSDVPKMIVKDVRINNINGKTLYFWELSKYAENGVYDEIKHTFASVSNPSWLIDAHFFWSKKISFETLKNPQIAYNSNENVIAIADRRSFNIYNPASHILTRQNNSSGFVHSNQPNQMIYNPVDCTYYSYIFRNTEGYAIASYNFSDRSWSNDSVREIESEFWHHNRFISTTSNCLYTFGGYGQHRYRNQVNKYCFQTGKWEKLSFLDEQIPPRYLSGLGVIDENRLLLFGGYGSNSGFQFLSPGNYYDLYQINLQDFSVQKLWEMDPPADQFVVANSMIVDTLNGCFYALCFPQNQYATSFFLAKFYLDKPGYEIVSNTIPFYFNDILSYLDLFHNKETNELYAISFSSLPADTSATVSVYSLPYPSLSSQLLVRQLVKKKNPFNLLLWGFILATLILAGLGCRFFRKKKKNIEPPKEFAADDSRIIKPANGRNTKQAIFLFGGFQVRDKEGNNIIDEFSPMLKQLFLIILLNTLKEDGKGISSLELTDILWSNKSHDSARNNRSVMMSKLRQLFENVGPMNIESLNSYWVVKLSDEIYCDYREAMSLIRMMKEKDLRTKENVMKLLNIVSFGELLPNLQTEWVDPFKATFANQLVDLLIDVTNQKNLTFTPVELVHLADTLLIYDILNDDALKLKCRSLVKMGKNGLARATYNSFTKQYSVLFGTNYNYTFAQVIS